MISIRRVTQSESKKKRRIIVRRHQCDDDDSLWSALKLANTRSKEDRDGQWPCYDVTFKMIAKTSSESKWHEPSETTLETCNLILWWHMTWGMPIIIAWLEFATVGIWLEEWPSRQNKEETTIDCMSLSCKTAMRQHTYDCGLQVPKCHAMTGLWPNTRVASNAGPQRENILSRGDIAHHY
jgi:hypothetical protein